jgi:ABC-type glycerol-3-phosphate transport system substrate-binding protein
MKRCFNLSQLLVSFMIVLAVGGAGLSWISAQNDEITLTITLMAGMEYLEDARVFEQFERNHPDIRLHVVYKQFDEIIFPPALYSLEDHLQGSDDYTLSGDVVIASSGASLPPDISIEATRAGYYLDLNPLIQVDPTFDPSLYYPSAWQSVGWDGGVWALPLAAQIYTVIYDPDAFDAGGLAYPDSNWDLADYVHAIEALAVRDSSGATTIPGFIGYNRSDYALMYSLIGNGVADFTTIPTIPQFDQPSTLAFAEQWGSLYADGAALNGLYPYPDDFSPEQTPLSTDRLQATIYSDSAAALMPGGRAAITVSGFAVSSRTQHPEAAYTLAKYLAEDSRVAGAFVTSFGMTARARPTYTEMDSIDDAPYLIGSLSAENEALLAVALEQAIPLSQLLFFDYFRDGLTRSTDQSGDVRSALQEAQLGAQTNLQIALERRDQISDVVASAEPIADIEPDEIALRFGIDALGGIANQAAWDDFAETFVEEDAEVGQVIIETRTLSLERAVETYDCFYLPYNAVSIINVNTVINLDPLLLADINFHADDFLPGSLQQVERENQIWAYPIEIFPLVVWYSQSQLPQIAVQGQSISEFYATLDAQFASSGDQPAMVASQLGTTLLALLAAESSLPIDYRQNPPTIDFVNQAPVIRQLLDLARNGVIYYEPLATLAGGGRPSGTPLVVDMLTTPFVNRDGYTPTLLPSGSQFTPVTFDLGTTYISRSAANTEACYRFISALAQRVDLLGGLPVQRAIASSQVEAFQNLDRTALYELLATALSAPDALLFPFSSRGSSGKDFIMRYWLFHAFDRYVLDGANLENELADAERFTQAFLACADNLPSFDPSSGSRRDYNQNLVECAVQVDPTSGEYFNFG